MFSTQNYSMADADSLYDMSSDQDQDLSAVDADAEEDEVSEQGYVFILHEENI
jgi:hypothetical protein